MAANGTDNAQTANTPPAPPVNPLDMASGNASADSAVVENIVTNETTEDERILDFAPEIDQGLLKEVGPPKSLLLVFLKILFGVTVIASVVSLIFFTSQLTDVFDSLSKKFDVPNISKELSSSDDEILALQTDVNFYRYLQIKASLDEFIYYGDAFTKNYEISNSQTVSSTDRKKASSELNKARPKLASSLQDVQEKYVKSFTAPLISEELSGNKNTKQLFQTAMQEKLDEKSKPLASNSDVQAQRDYKNYQDIKSIVSNEALKDIALMASVEAMSDEEVYVFVKMTNMMYTNDLSIIQLIRDFRIKWSDIMEEIDLRTIAVDQYYNQDNYDTIGGIRYTSYDFDSVDKSISIIGEIKRYDTVNFTMIANLIDELNASETFEDAEMRSFSKAGSLDDGYTSSVRLKLTLEGFIVQELGTEDEYLDEIPPEMMEEDF
ncbi:hypothetical protein HN709_04100 [Candidatus Peregrinibacteria bacterium]|nr:hypothetical protein [Candidatus Peregrinibacteria bacterium]MBT7736847.1 hypothetical protein [Candidatus Peregrinibacteria bacterium]